MIAVLAFLLVCTSVSIAGLGYAWWQTTVEHRGAMLLLGDARIQAMIRAELHRDRLAYEVDRSRKEGHRAGHTLGMKEGASLERTKIHTEVGELTAVDTILPAHVANDPAGLLKMKRQIVEAMEENGHGVRSFPHVEMLPLPLHLAEIYPERQYGRMVVLRMTYLTTPLVPPPTWGSPKVFEYRLNDHKIERAY